MVHGTGADQHSYQMAIGGALAIGKFLLIETDSAHVREWREKLLAHKVGFFALVPRDGGAHPIVPPRSAMQ
jgi:hypothetical protein